MRVRLSNAEVHAFGPYTLSSSERVLRYRGQPVAVAAKAVDLLLVLLQRPGEVVSKQIIMDRLWPQSFVEDGNLTQTVYLLRRLFKDHHAGVAIENIPKRGYRIVVPSETRAARTSPWLRAALAACIALALVTAGTLYIVGHRGSSNDALAGTALQKYMLAQSYQSDGSPENLHRSVRILADVVRTQPSSALGYAGLAVSEASLAYYTKDAAERIRLQADALTNAREAVSKNPESADAQAALGGVELSIAHDGVAAEPHLRRAIALDPNQFNALAWYGSLLMDQGRIEQARRVFTRAVAIAPNSAGTIASLAWCDFIAGDMDDAIALSQQQLRAKREPALAMLTLANAYVQKRSFAAARGQIAQLANSGGWQLQAAAIEAQLEAQAGRRDRALKRLAALDTKTDLRRIDSWDAASIAAAYLAANDRARAFLWLARIEPWHRPQIFRDPRFAALSTDRRFAAWERD